MNSHMYFNKAMQKNIELIKELGYHILEPKVLDKEEKTGGSILDLYQKRGGTAYLSVPDVEDVVEIMKMVLSKQ